MNVMSSKRRLLVDVSGLAYKYLTTTTLNAKSGQRTNIIYGVFGDIEKLIRTWDPAEVVICWDGGSAKRRAIYPQYKANRKKDPVLMADLEDQLTQLRGLFETLPIINLHFPGIEADDVIACLCKFLHLEKIGIVTHDYDLYCYAKSNHVLINKKGTRVKCEKPYSYYFNLKVLAGDSADNVKGVGGIGQVKATKLLDRFKTLKGILVALQNRDPECLEIIPKGTRYEDLKEAILANNKLLKPGILLTPEETNRILQTYKIARLKTALHLPQFQQRCKELSFVSFLTRMTGLRNLFRPLAKTVIDQPTGVQEIKQNAVSTKAQSAVTAHAKIEETLVRRIRIPVTDDSGREHSEERYVRRLRKPLQEVHRGAGSESSITEKARASSDLFKRKFAQLDSCRDNGNAERALPGGNEQTRSSGVRRAAEAILARKGISSKRQDRQYEAVSLLQSFRPKGEAFEWLKNQPATDLKGVMDIIDKITFKLPTTDSDIEFLKSLHNRFADMPPAWM